MTRHACPYCSSEDLGIIDVLGKSYSVGCRICGMSGPQGTTVEEAEKAWNGLCLKFCNHCISRPWGRALAKRVQQLSEAALCAPKENTPE